MLRLWLFLSLLALFGTAEWLWPKHRAAPQRRRRWPVNLGLGAIDVLSLRVLSPWLAVDAATWAQANHVGVLPQLRFAPWISGALAFLLLDLAIYVQHRIMHRIGWLWRLHRVHHTDLTLDVTSGVRFHPLEILVSMAIKIAVVLGLGAAPAAVVAFEAALSSFSLATHANFAIPRRLDRWLRLVLVTPDMHRIHHSVVRAEHDSNFGFQISLWDRLFGSYRTAARADESSMPLGLDRFRDASDQRLPALLGQPLAAR